MKAVNEKQYTARDLAATFGCSVMTIARHADKLFGKAQGGVARHFDEAQTTLLLESIKRIKQAGGRRALTSDVKVKQAGGRGTSQTVWKVEEVDLSKRLVKAETNLTPMLRLKLIQEQKERLHDEECEIYRGEIKRLEELSACQAAWIDDALKANTQLYGIAESAGALTTDREDTLALYRR
jgi:hypothetical protein